LRPTDRRPKDVGPCLRRTCFLGICKVCRQAYAWCHRPWRLPKKLIEKSLKKRAECSYFFWGAVFGTRGPPGRSQGEFWGRSGGCRNGLWAKKPIFGSPGGLEICSRFRLDFVCKKSLRFFKIGLRSLKKSAIFGSKFDRENRTRGRPKSVLNF